MDGTRTTPTDVADATALRFPCKSSCRAATALDSDCTHDDAGANALTALYDVSRKMEDLARELNCLGYFNDDDDNRPRAA